MQLANPLVSSGLVLLSLLLLAGSASAQTPATESLRLDALRIKGTHNSYHRRPFLVLHPRHAYEHDSLFVQLEYHGVRALELDLHLSDEGYEVYHIRFIDGRSHCRAFVDCLSEIRAWSDLDRSHEPLVIWLEAKDFAGGERMQTLRPVDDVLRRVLGDRLLTPDDVRGPHASLHSALASDGWPTLGESRGKILFMLTANLEQRADYTSGFRHLEGRAMFVEADPDQYDQPWAAVAKVWQSEVRLMGRARAQGLLISTVTCTAEQSDPECVRSRQRALANGANVLLDDYPRATPGRSDFLDLGADVISVVRPALRHEKASEIAVPGG